MKTGLSKKILIPILLAVALCLAAAMISSYSKAKLVIQQKLAQQLGREVNLTVNLMDNWLEGRRKDVATWGLQDVLSEALTEEGYYGKSARQGARDVLATLEKGYAYYDIILLADLEGNLVATSHQFINPDINIVDRHYFQEAAQGGVYVSKVITSRESGEKVFTISSPVRQEGKVVGVLSGAVNLDFFQTIFVDDFQLSENSYTFIVNGAGVLVAISKANQLDLGVDKHLDFIQRVTTGGGKNFFYDLNGVEVLTASRRLQQTNWYFCVTQSLDDVLHPLKSVGKFSIILSIIMLVLVSGFIVVLFRWVIANRLREILAVINTIQKGEFKKTIRLSTYHDDELTELAESFNSMIVQLDTSMMELNEEIQVRKRAELKLADHHENLERVVRERSLELEREIAGRKEIERKLLRAAKLEMIGTLAGGVAHDLNNILSGIVTYPDLLLKKIPDNSPLIKPLQTIKDSGEKASAIVLDLLTLARRTVAVKEAVNINTIIRSYMDSPEFNQLIQHHQDISVTASLDEELLNITGSPVHLSKTIMNLVANAAESMPKGGHVTITTENRYIDSPVNLYENIREGDFVALSVADQGCGISSEESEKIFEPFYTSKTMGKSGTGLGMAVVWGTVKDHLGFINLESEIGKGTKFTLYFPVGNGFVGEGKQESIAGSNYQGNGEMILVVDDIEEQREIASAILKELGYSVTTAASGELAVAIAREKRFDLVVLDMIMGDGMDGLDTYSQLLTITPGQKAIITSGFSETERISEAIRLGVGQYIKKPYMIERIGLAIQKELSAG